MKNSNLEDEKFNQACLFQAFQRKIQRRLLRNAVKNTSKKGLIALAGAAAISALDYFGIQSGYTQNALDALVRNYHYLMQPAEDSNMPLILSEDYRRWLLLTGISLIGAHSLARLGLNWFASKSYRDRNSIVEAVLSVPHYSKESEFNRYNRLTGRSKHYWERDIQSYFEVLVEWGRIELRALALQGNNVSKAFRAPKKILAKNTGAHPTLEEIVDGLNQREDREPLIVSPFQPQKVSFPLPSQLNQPDMYFQGYVFDKLPRAKNFLGFQTVCHELSSHKWVIGSCTPEKSTSLLLGRRKRFAQEIQQEILHPFYYTSPPENARKIAIVSEGTYPVYPGGVATLIAAMIRDLKPKYFGGLLPYYELVSILALTDPYKTMISYKLPKNAHMNPPINVFGYTNNPSLDVTKEIPASSVLFSDRKKGESKKAHRKRELKRTIYDLEEAIATSNIPLFYKVADRIQFFSAEEMLGSVEKVEVLHDIYHKITDKDKPDFRAYQYGYADVRQPLINVIKSKKAPADVYYSLCTGVGGVYAALAKRQFNAGFVLTEHGIYTKDREVDIACSEMSPFVARKWKQALRFYSKISYDAADFITTTCASNRLKQIRDGAPPHKIKVLPGGISLEKKLEPGSLLPDYDSMAVGLLGNVQRVKRVELFIDVAEYLLKHYPQIKWKFYVMGRDDEHDKAYASQIHNRVEQNPELAKIFYFTPYGPNSPYGTNYKEAYAKLDVGVLTSSSEVQPISIFECLSLGKPMIGMDVGGIDETINGTGIDNLGPAGLVIDVDTPERVEESAANAILTMYLRKYYLLRREKSSIPEPPGSKFSYLLEQKMPIEEVGPKRIEASFCSDKILPEYAKLFEGSIPKVMVA